MAHPIRPASEYHLAPSGASQCITRLMGLPVTYYNRILNEIRLFRTALPFTNQYVLAIHHLDHPTSSQCHGACVSHKSPPPIRQNHIQVRKGLGQACHIPKSNRSYTHHTVVIKCRLKLARRKALEETFSRLKEKDLGDMAQSAADMFNGDPADLDGDYTDVEGPQPRNQMHKNEIGEARLRDYDTWKDLAPSQGN